MLVRIARSRRFALAGLIILIIAGGGGMIRAYDLNVVGIGFTVGVAFAAVLLAVMLTAGKDEFQPGARIMAAVALAFIAILVQGFFATGTFSNPADEPREVVMVTYEPTSTPATAPQQYVERK